MFGDCQVMSSMEGNVVPSESLFTSQIQNPSFNNFMPNMPFNSFSDQKDETAGYLRSKDEVESTGGSGSEQVEEKSGNEYENEQPPKKKRYHRHTTQQIQEMESLFKECPHPDDKQRLKLSQELGLKPRQVKFWFQNRRTQMKAQQDRSDNVILRSENENLKSENYRLQAMLRSLVCPTCGGGAILGEPVFDEQQLRLENARLREELERVYVLAPQYGGRPMQALPPAPSPFLAPSLDLDMNIYSRNFGEPLPNCSQIMHMPMLPEAPHFSEEGLMLMDEEKSFALELAMSSSDQLVKLCKIAEPLWSRNNETGRETLNVEEYARMFPWALNLKQVLSEFRTEASRDSVVVIMNSITLVDAFLDAGKWMELFPSIVSKARTVQIISSDVSGHPSGFLQLMYAEFQVLTPLVPTREAHFLRYCQQNADKVSWVIVDIPIDSFRENLQTSFPRFRRRPSGCVIQDMPNGYSEVTWVEHVDIEEEPVHQTFNRFLHSGMAFGAQRCLQVLRRQCERNASLMARNISDLGVIPSPEARKNLMKLAERMIRTFCVNISTSGGQKWTALSDSSDDTVRITTRKSIEPGQPNGVILSAVSTTWLPYPHNQVFDLLRDERRRSQLDIVPNGNSLHEVAHIANGQDPGNCISLLRINVASSSSQNIELMLQESSTDKSGSLIVYTTIDVDAIQIAMSGEDPSRIPLLPMGFSIVPAGPTAASTSINNTSSPTISPKEGNQPVSNECCLLTVGLQVLASTNPSAKLNLSTVTAINNHLCNTVNQITAAMSTMRCPDNGTVVGPDGGPTGTQ